jgi:hypothetical protein
MTAASVTVDKDFRVKNGLVVANGGLFGGTVTVATPTSNSHAATKEYVDSVTVMTVSSTAPSSPTNGTQWLDTSTNRVNFYYSGTWYTQATIDDTNSIPDHIHDTAIDGTGLIVSQFIDSGFFDSPMTSSTDSGNASDTIFTSTTDGGVAIDHFN